MSTHRVADVLLAAVLGLTAAEVRAEKFTWKQDREQLALATEGGGIVWQFNHGATAAKPYFHPVALPGRPTLTWNTPVDHPWHLGLWFSWKFINRVNYWETDRKTGRAEGLTRIDRVATTPRPDYSARLELDLSYVPPSAAEPALTEKRIVEVSAPAADGSYHFDWTMTFTAGSTDARLDRTPLATETGGKPWGGYAGLIWRFAREFTEWRAVNAAGAVDAAAHGTPASGCDFSGMLEGMPTGVAMIDHPQNLRSPTPWYLSLEQSTPFACLMPAALFHSAYTIAAGQSLTLRYRVIVHPERWSPDRLQQEVGAFSGQ